MKERVSRHKSINSTELLSVELHNLAAIASRIDNEIAERKRAEEQTLANYTKTRFNAHPEGIRSSLEPEDRPVTRLRERLLIPYGLNEVDKQILEQFYGRRD